MVKAGFTETNANFANPERGWSRYLATDFAQLDDGNVAYAVNSGITVGSANVRLDNYRDRALPDTLLAQIQAAFDKVRAGGLKVRLRFVYNYPSGTVLTSDQDAPLAIVQQHIAQLAPVIAKNADVIAVWQAGFIGLWGEGHTSSNKLDTAENKIKVRDALLNALPKDRILEWRYPGDLLAWSPTAPATQDAFNNSLAARIGVHNDCFMSSDDDVGTYNWVPSVAAKEREYTKAVSANTPFGGETCNASVSQARTRCSAILTEGRDYHLNYLDRDYYTGFHDQWKAQGCFEEVERSMGYRFVVTDAEAPVSGSAGADSSFAVTVKNVGWSRVFNPRPLQLTLRNQTTGAELRAVATLDLRSLLPGVSASTFGFIVKVPADAAKGKYDIYLSSPDGSASLANDARYAIRFANADDGSKGQQWSPAAGRFKLGLTFDLR